MTLGESSRRPDNEAMFRRMSYLLVFLMMFAQMHSQLQRMQRQQQNAPARE